MEVDVSDDLHEGNGFGDPTGEFLEDLRESNINFSISWIANQGTDVKVGDEVTGVVTQERVPGRVADAIGWLSDKACELYPNTKFAAKYTYIPPYESPYDVASPEARAVGCICPGLRQDGEMYSNTNCPEHGISKYRVIDGARVYVGANWRPDRPRSASTKS